MGDFGDDDVIDLTADSDSDNDKDASAASAAMPAPATCAVCYVKPCAAPFGVCGHTFCAECVVKSLQFSRLCPMCRTPAHG